MSPRYIVATDTPLLSGLQAARLYKLEGAGDRAVLSAQGDAQQMQALADELNGANERPAQLKLVDERDPECVKAWPECASSEYDPACCRFPKSCSAGVVRMVPAEAGEAS